MTSSSGREVSPLREGGGRIALPRADQPLVFASPTSSRFGFLAAASSLTQKRRLSAMPARRCGSCAVAIQRSRIGARRHAAGAAAAVTVPGNLHLERKASARRRRRHRRLDSPHLRRRAPSYSLLAATLGSAARRKKVTHPPVLRHLRGQQRQERRRWSISYLYPERAPDVPTVLMRAPSRSSASRSRSARQNFGVVVLSQARGVAVSPRIVRGTSERPARRA